MKSIEDHTGDEKDNESALEIAAPRTASAAASNPLPALSLDELKVEYGERLAGAITRLAEFQRELGKGADGAVSHERFANDVLGLCGTTWSRLTRGKYPVLKGQKGKPEYVTACERKAAELEGRMDKALAAMAKKPKAEALPFLLFPHFEAILSAVQMVQGRDQEDPRRLVVYPAPTGGGKTRMLAWLKSKVNSFSVVHARPSWRTSYRDVLYAIGKALGLSLGFNLSKGRVEEMLLEELGKKRGHVLAIDEGNNFSPDTIDLLKLLLNESTCVILLCCTESHFRRMQDHWDEFVQLKGRVNMVPWTRLLAEHVERFLRAARDGEGQPLRLEKPRKLAEKLVEVATEKGADNYRMVVRVIEFLVVAQEDLDPAGKLGTEELEVAIRNAKAVVAQGWKESWR